MELDLRELLQQANGVVHLAAEPGVRASWGANFSKYLRRNVEATQRLLEAVSKRSLERFIFASSSSVYGSVEGRPVGEDAPLRPASPYALSKLAAEELGGLYRRVRGMPATVLRYFTVYGPRQRPEMAVSRFTSAAAQKSRSGGVGEGTQTTVNELVKAVGKALGVQPKVVYGPAV